MMIDGVTPPTGGAAEVRAVVHGYRRGSLERELQGVQSVLVSAGVACQITPSAQDLSAPVEEALAWSVREAATNLLRHSAATHCEIEIRDHGDRVYLSVHNDGAGVAGAAGPDRIGGTGLLGLAERLAAVGGTLTAAPDRQGNFLLTAFIPMVGAGRNP
jgi:two-component system, NarL family, sensor histidine kinase DesK